MSTRKGGKPPFNPLTAENIQSAANTYQYHKLGAGKSGLRTLNKRNFEKEPNLIYVRSLRIVGPRPQVEDFLSKSGVSQGDVSSLLSDNNTFTASNIMGSQQAAYEGELQAR